MTAQNTEQPTGAAMTSENVSERPTAEGTYEYLRATRTYRKIDEDGDICRHIERPRKILRVSYAGAAARRLPMVHVGPCCERCAEDYRDQIDTGNSPVWQGDSLPIISVEGVNE